MNQFIQDNQVLLLTLLGFLVNTLATSLLVRRVDPESFWGKALHIVLQGFAAVLAPKSDGVKTGAPESKANLALLVLLSTLCLPLVISCGSWWKSATVWDAAQDLCEAALTSKPEVQAAATSRGLTKEEWGEYICHFDDVYELFVRQPGMKSAATPPVGEALTRARAHGAL